MRDGFGKMDWLDGGVYDGEWKHNRACGKGKFIYPDGHTYNG